MIRSSIDGIHSLGTLHKEIIQNEFPQYTCTLSDILSVGKLIFLHVKNNSKIILTASFSSSCIEILLHAGSERHERHERHDDTIYYADPRCTMDLLSNILRAYVAFSRLSEPRYG